MVPLQSHRGGLLKPPRRYYYYQIITSLKMILDGSLPKPMPRLY